MWGVTDFHHQNAKKLRGVKSIYCTYFKFKTCFNFTKTITGRSNDRFVNINSKLYKNFDSLSHSGLTYDRIYNNLMFSRILSFPKNSKFIKNVSIEVVY